MNSPTHCKGNTLDLVITNNEHSVCDLTVLPPQCGTICTIPTDHSLITFYTTSHTPQRNPTPLASALVFDYPKADLEGLSCYLLDYDFSICLQSSCIGIVWTNIKEAVTNAMNLFIPKVRLRRHQTPKWYTSDIRHHLNCLNTLRKK